MAQRRDEGGCRPLAVQYLVDQALAARRAAVEAGDIARNAGFIDEHQPLGIKPALIGLPPDPAASDVGAILLAGVQSFF